MESKTLEQYFLQDYEELKARCECQANRLRELEERDYGFGVTDLHEKTQVVKGSTCSSWVIKEYLLKNGKMTVEQLQEVMELGDQALFKKYKNESLNYYRVISYEEHEFQYKLFIKESRVEWTAVTDGGKDNRLMVVEPRLFGEELCEDEWYPIGEAEALQSFLAQGLRKVMEEALLEYEREQAEKEGSDEGAA